MKASSLYTGERGAEYYAQRKMLLSEDIQGERAVFFLDIADESMVILDFGCGSGGLLAHLKAAKRIGVDISPYARRDAEQRLDSVVSTVRDIADESIDVVVSFHALEHVDDPQLVIRHMWRILRPGGAMRLVVPCDIPVLTKGHRSWELDDMNMHLYSWSPLTLGNLVSVCGFKVDDARLVPDSAGGRLGRMLPESSMLRQWLSWFKALRGGRFHTIVTARKTPVVDTGR